MQFPVCQIASSGILERPFTQLYLLDFRRTLWMQSRNRKGCNPSCPKVPSVRKGFASNGTCYHRRFCPCIRRSIRVFRHLRRVDCTWGQESWKIVASSSSYSRCNPSCADLHIPKHDLHFPPSKEADNSILLASRQRKASAWELSQGSSAS